VIVPFVAPVATVIAARAVFEFAIVPVHEICVLPPTKLYPYAAVKPVVVGRLKVVPAGGLTNPTETSRVALEPKPANTKSPGSWPDVLSASVGAAGAVTDVAANAGRSDRLRSG
jgi:hypothetical protein